MTAVGVVPHVSQELCLGGAGRHQERVAVETNEDLAGTLVLERSAPLERPLVEDLDPVARALVRDDLLDALAKPGRADRLLRVSSRAHRELEDPADQVAERVPAPGDAGGHLLHVAAARAVPLGRQRVEAAPRAAVTESFGDRHGGLGRCDQLALHRAGRLPFLVDLLPRDDLDARSLGVLRVVDHPELRPGTVEVQRQRLRGHRFPDARRADQEEVTVLVGRDPSDLDRLLLADHAVERVGRDVDVLGGFDLVERGGSSVSGVVRGDRHGTPGKVRERVIGSSRSRVGVAPRRSGAWLSGPRSRRSGPPS